MRSGSVPPKQIVILLILSVLVAYVPVIGAGYIWDDDVLVTANPQMKNAAGLKEIWQGRNCRDYTPLTLTAFWLERRVFGNEAAGYHAINIVLHAISVLLLWRILGALNVRGAWLAALLFAIHPVNVASVAWVAELKNTLSAVLFFGALLAYLRSDRRPGGGWYAASMAMFLLAALSKGSVVTFPVVILGCALWVNGKITRRDCFRAVPFVLIAFVIALLTIRYQSRAVDYGLVPEGAAFRLARAGMIVWQHLRAIFLPIGLNPMRPMEFPDTRSLFTWIPLAGAVLAGAAFFHWRRKSGVRQLLFGYGWYLLMLLPVLGFVRMALMQETPCADWWQYMAVPGIFACVGAGYEAIDARFVDRNRTVILRVLLGLVIACLFVQTWRRGAIYESMETYCRAVVAENPHAWSIQNNLGIVLKQQSHLAEAIVCYQQALRDNPGFSEARNNLGNALAATGDQAGAEREFQAALKQNPQNPDVLENLAELFFRQGKMMDALANEAAAIKADRYNPRLYNRFGLMLAANKQFDQAAACFRNGLVLQPGDLEMQINLSQVLFEAGHLPEATAACEQALRQAQKSGDEKLIHMLASLLNRCKKAARRH